MAFPLNIYGTSLKAKSGVVVIVDYSRDYTVVIGVVLFQLFSLSNLRNYISQSAKKYEMTSF